MSLPINLHSQFISMNHAILADMVFRFHELNRLFGESLVLTLDNQGWEIFDCNVSKTIIRHEFKHLKAMCEDMSKLLRAKTDFFLGFDLPSPKYKRNQRWAYKSLLKFYTEKEIYLLSNSFGYGKINKVKDLENHY